MKILTHLERPLTCPALSWRHRPFLQAYRLASRPVDRYQKRHLFITSTRLVFMQGPNAKQPSADIYDTATDTSTSGTQGVKTTTPGYPGPRTAPPTTAPQPPPPSKPPSGVTANRHWPPPASNPAPPSLKEVEPLSAAPPNTTKQSSLPK